MANKKFILDGTISWAKVFPENMDKADFHMQKGGGAYTCNFYFNPETEEDDIAKIKDAGMPDAQLGYPVFRKDDTGTFLKLKRMHKGPFVNDDGVDVFGGPPKIYDHTDGPSAKAWEWNDGEGELGNGTEVKVILEYWETKRGRGLRLLEIAVVKQEVYEGGHSGDDDATFSLAG